MTDHVPFATLNNYILLTLEKNDENHNLQIFVISKLLTTISI